MPARATAPRVAARAPAAAASPTHAVQRCSCGSGEKDGECEECRSQAVQTSSLAGSPGAPPAGAGAAAGHALGALDIFYRSPDEADQGGEAGAIQRSAAVAPPAGREEAEEPEPGAPAAAADASLEPGDDGEAVAAIEAGEPFGSSGGSGGQAGALAEDEALQTFSPGSPSAGPTAGRPVDARAVRHRLAGGGRELPRSLRRPMERFFGRDLSAVRVHADDRAGRLAGALSSAAFAVGEHVVFASGAWRPGAAGGRALLAHELQHVLQQRAGLSGEIVRRGIGRPGDAWERAAEAAAREFSRREAREGGPAEAPGDPAAERTGAPADGAPLPTAGAAPALSPASGGGLDGALQLYSGSDAAAYGRRWAESINSAYGEFDNDCTNFVSQCLEAGGWQMVTGCHRCAERKDNDVWWFQRDACWRPIVANVHASHTWGGAHNLYRFLRAGGRGQAQGHVMDLGVGDVLQFDNDGNRHIRHTMLVTRKTDGNLFLSYHTSAHLDEPFYPDGDNDGILARNPSPPKNYYAWKITGDSGPTHTCPSCTPQYLGFGAYLGSDCIVRQGPGGPKI